MNRCIITSMGSFTENNDTLQITKEQGFPTELVLETHLQTPYKVESFEGEIFEFKDKPEIRNYQQPPVRNFLVENRNGKWIYWGLIHVLEITHDYVNKTTSGKFKIIHINTPEEMKKAFELIDRNPETNYFG
ncbi:MAG: hypothetical protein WBO77_02585 [Microgenomates group bacterium]